MRSLHTPCEMVTSAKWLMCMMLSLYWGDRVWRKKNTYSQNLHTLVQPSFSGYWKTIIQKYRCLLVYLHILVAIQCQYYFSCCLKETRVFKLKTSSLMILLAYSLFTMFLLSSGKVRWTICLFSYDISSTVILKTEAMIQYGFSPVKPLVRVDVVFKSPNTKHHFINIGTFSISTIRGKNGKSILFTKFS